MVLRKILYRKKVEKVTGAEAKKRLEKQYKRQNDYINTKYDRISVTVPKGTKEKIKAHGEKPNTLINRLIAEWLQAIETDPEV